MVELPWAAGCCPCVEKLRTVLPLPVGIRDGVVHLHPSGGVATSCRERQLFTHLQDLLAVAAQRRLALRRLRILAQQVGTGAVITGGPHTRQPRALPLQAKEGARHTRQYPLQLRASAF